MVWAYYELEGVQILRPQMKLHLSKSKWGFPGSCLAGGGGLLSQTILSSVDNSDYMQQTHLNDAVQMKSTPPCKSLCQCRAKSSINIDQYFITSACVSNFLISWIVEEMLKQLLQH